MQATRLDTPDVAKRVRKDLQTRWPEVKFSVRSRRYSGGSSIDIGWYDGPTSDQVRSVVGWMEGADFDGMTDMKSYRPDVLVANADGSTELVDFGVDFIQEARRETAGTLRKLLAEVCEFAGVDPAAIGAEVVDSEHGGYIKLERYDRLPVAASWHRGSLGAGLARDTHGPGDDLTCLVRTLWSFRDYSVRCEHEHGTYALGNGWHRCQGCGMRTQRVIPEACAL